MTDRPGDALTDAGEDGDELPGNFRRTVERFSALEPALRAGADPRVEIEARVKRLEELFAPFDAVHLLGQFIFSETRMDPESYVESEHPGAGYVVELVAAMLVTRPSRAGAADPEPPIDANTTKPTRELVQEIVLLEGLRRQRQLASTALGAAQARVAQQNLMLRGPSWPEQERAVLRGLFGFKQLAERIQAGLGFDVEQAIAVVEALPKLVNGQLADHQARALDSTDEAMTWFSSVLSTTTPLDQQTVERVAAAVWSLQTLGEALVVRDESLAAAAGIPLEATKAMIGRLSSSFGQSEDLFRRAEAIRNRPYLALDEGRFLPTVLGNDLWTLRGVFQEALADSDAFARHRGSWLEQDAATLLADALPPDEIHRRVRIRRDELDVGEIDALLRYGDTVITIEAKSATMRPSARRGGDSLLDHLKQVVKKTSEQSELARRALTGEEPLELVGQDGAPLALPEIREVQPIVVTLDDISAVAPVLWQLIGTKVLPERAFIPWVVTIFELELVCQTAQWPMQLVHFLRRRARLNEIGGVHAADELDWWMLYFKQGLYFEDDAEVTSGEVRYLSQTDELDAWYLHSQGRRETPAAKPKQVLEPETKKMLDFLDDHRPGGFIPAGCILLDVSSETRRALHAQLQEGRVRALKRRAAQRGTLCFEPPEHPFMICWLVCPDEWARQLARLLGDLVAERFEQHGKQAVLAIGLTASSPRPLDALVVAEPSRWRS